MPLNRDGDEFCFHSRTLASASAPAPAPAPAPTPTPTPEPCSRVFYILHQSCAFHFRCTEVCNFSFEKKKKKKKREDGITNTI